MESVKTTTYKAEVVIQNITYRVGDKVKLLIKEYSSEYVYNGILANISFFGEKPVVEVIYWKGQYDGVASAVISDGNPSNQITKFSNDLEGDADMKVNLMQYFDREVERKESELFDLKQKRARYLEFMERFSAAKEGR